MTVTAREQTIAELRRRMGQVTDRLGQRRDPAGLAVGVGTPRPVGADAPRPVGVDPRPAGPTSTPGAWSGPADGFGSAPGRLLPSLPGLQGVPRLRAGAVHRVDNLALALALSGGSSHHGGWLGVVGLPELGYEAAAEAGIELDRTIVIPEPGDRWPAVLAELAEVTDVVLIRPPGRLSAGQAEKLRARLRLHETALVSCGPWPRTEVEYGLRASRWFGPGRGDGHLRTRQAEVEVERPGRPRERFTLWLPGDQLRIAVDEKPAPAPVDALPDHDRHDHDRHDRDHSAVDHGRFDRMAG